MRWADFAAQTPAFKLVGGPFDGREIPTAMYVAWPSHIQVYGAKGLSRYAMRIGDADHYDWDGAEPISLSTGGDKL